MRVALIDFVRAKADPVPDSLEPELRRALNRDERIIMIDRSIAEAALTGIGYDGSINLSRDEARGLGSAIGCDFFIAGKTEALTRSEREGESHEEAYAGLFVIDGRTGALACFDFVKEKGVSRASAVDSTARSIVARAGLYVDRMMAYRRNLNAPGPPSIEPIEDIPEEGSPRAAGFTPPDFLNRVRPEYPPQAEDANITATVEALAVFRASGEIGLVEVTRWAGFGLDESAERAIRQLKFKPALRDGNPVTVRALIRYNFRRLSEPASQSDPPAIEAPPDKPALDLRRLFKPTYRRPMR